MTQLNPEQIINEVERLASSDEFEVVLNATIDLTKDEPDIQYLLERGEIGCFPIGDIVVIKGKAKAGKSTLLTVIMAALLKGDFIGFKARKPGASVLYIDTEQGRANTRKLANKVHRICQLSIVKPPAPQFNAMNLRGNDARERCGIVRDAVKYYSPDLLIIDGAKDLLSNGDINDPKAAGETLQLLMTITKDYPLSLITILHENKNDNNLRGHLGTELVNKCAECYQVYKDEGMFNIEQTENRNGEMPGFAFKLNAEALPVEVEPVAKLSPKERNRQVKIEAFYFCLNGKRLTYSDLKTEYCQAAGVSEKTAERNIGEFTRNGTLIKDEKTGEYRFNISKIPILKNDKSPAMNPENLTP